MKKNALYFAILIALLSITYYLHESGDIRRAQAFQDKHQLFQPDKLGELLAFENKVTTLVKKEGDFYLKDLDFLVDQTQFESLSQTLSHIQAVRFLEPEELAQLDRALLFPRPEDKLRFRFSQGEVEYLIGEKLAFDQTFYLEVRWRYHEGQEEKVQTVIARDASPERGVHFEQTFHRSDQKYRRLLALLYLDQQVFAQRSPFAFLKGEALHRVSVLNEKNRPYSFSFLKATTEPPAPKASVEYPKEKFQNWLNQLSEMSAARVAFFDMIEPGQKPLSRLVISTEKAQYEWKLYQGEEFIVQLSGLANVSFVFDQAPPIFYLPVSFFWDKTPKNQDAVFLSEIEQEQQKKMAELFSREADGLEAIETWQAIKQMKRLSLSDKRFVVYSYENELQLWDTRDDLVYRYWDHDLKL